MKCPNCNSEVDATSLPLEFDPRAGRVARCPICRRRIFIARVKAVFPRVKPKMTKKERRRLAEENRAAAIRRIQEKKGE
jgi:hypothetical protein